MLVTLIRDVYRTGATTKSTNSHSFIDDGARHKFGWTLEQMGEARYRELLDVKRLDLTDMRVLNLPDGGLKQLDPWTIEQSIRMKLRVEPHVVVTCPIHGISGFHDHIVAHFGVTRVYLELCGPDSLWYWLAHSPELDPHVTQRADLIHPRFSDRELEVAPVVQRA